ncbi:hypothetical protein HDU76_009129 [Blyttiomyces sp. JEL0837]|nr:hypothetical protein HDU76_009129 [Blyttiomyces sp. JEL0837]
MSGSSDALEKLPDMLMDYLENEPLCHVAIKNDLLNCASEPLNGNAVVHDDTRQAGWGAMLSASRDDPSLIQLTTGVKFIEMEVPNIPTPSNPLPPLRALANAYRANFQNMQQNGVAGEPVIQNTNGDQPVNNATLMAISPAERARNVARSLAFLRNAVNGLPNESNNENGAEEGGETGHENDDHLDNEMNRDVGEGSANPDPQETEVETPDDDDENEMAAIWPFGDPTLMGMNGNGQGFQGIPQQLWRDAVAAAAAMTNLAGLNLGDHHAAHAAALAGVNAVDHGAIHAAALAGVNAGEHGAIHAAALAGAGANAGNQDLLGAATLAGINIVDHAAVHAAHVAAAHAVHAHHHHHFPFFRVPNGGPEYTVELFSNRFEELVDKEEDLKGLLMGCLVKEESKKEDLDDNTGTSSNGGSSLVTSRGGYKVSKYFNGLGAFVKKLALPSYDCNVSWLPILNVLLPNLQCLHFQHIQSEKSPPATPLLTQLPISFAPILQNITSFTIEDAHETGWSEICGVLRMLCPNLRSLNIEAVGNMDAFDSEVDMETVFPQLPKLEFLRLDGVTVGLNTAITCLATSCKNMKAITIDYCLNISMGAFQILWNNCENLAFLALAGIVDPLENPSLVDRPSLKTLRLVDCDVTDSLFEQVGKFATCLEMIRIVFEDDRCDGVLRTTQALTDRTLLAFVADCGAGVGVATSPMSGGSGGSPMSISSSPFSNMPTTRRRPSTLQRLALTWCPNMTAGALCAVLDTNPVKILDLHKDADCSLGNLNEEVLTALEGHLGRIEVLHLYGQIQLMDTTLCRLFSSTFLPSLRSVCLNGTMVTMETIRELSRHSPKLDAISLISCPEISIDDVKAFLRKREDGGEAPEKLLRFYTLVFSNGEEECPHNPPCANHGSGTGGAAGNANARTATGTRTVTDAENGSVHGTGSGTGTLIVDGDGEPGGTWVNGIVENDGGNAVWHDDLTVLDGDGDDDEKTEDLVFPPLASGGGSWSGKCDKDEGRTVNDEGHKLENGEVGTSGGVNVVSASCSRGNNEGTQSWWEGSSTMHAVELSKMDNGDVIGNKMMQTAIWCDDGSAEQEQYDARAGAKQGDQDEIENDGAREDADADKENWKGKGKERECGDVGITTATKTKEEGGGGGEKDRYELPRCIVKEDRWFLDEALDIISLFETAVWRECGKAKFFV